MSDSPAKSVSDAEIARLTRDFGRARGEERRRVFQAIRDLGEAGTDALLRLLKEEELKRSLTYRLTGIGFILLVFVLVGLGTASNRLPWLSPFIGVTLMVWFGSLLFLAKALIPSQLERTAQAIFSCQFETLADPRAIGPLLDAYEVFKDANLNQYNRLALTRLLAGLTARDAGALSPRHRNALARILAKAVQSQASVRGAAAWKPLTPESADFLVALLNATAVVGGKENLRPVQEVSAMEPRDENDRRVQQAAQACYDTLRKRFPTR